MHRLAGENRNRLVARTGRPVRAGPSIGDFGAGEHARERGHARVHSAAHPCPGRTNSLGNVIDPAFLVPSFAQSDGNSKVAAGPARALNDNIVSTPYLRGAA